MKKLKNCKVECDHRKEAEGLILCSKNLKGKKMKISLTDRIFFAIHCAEQKENNRCPKNLTELQIQG